MTEQLENVYQERLELIQKAMVKVGIDGFIVTQNVDLYYMTGSMQTGQLFVPVVGEPTFFVRRSLTRAEVESAFAVESMSGFKALHNKLSPYKSVNGIGETEGETAHATLVLATEFDVLPVANFQRLQAAFPGARWVDGSLIIRELRMIKSPQEIAAIKHAASVVDAALAAGLRHVRAGMPEFELMAHIEHQLRLHAHAGLMRMRAYNAELITGVVAAGPAAAEPTYFDGPAGGLGLSKSSPQGASHRPIQPGEPILLDLGCMIDGYVIDQTRTAVIGKLPADLQHAYEVAEAVIHATEVKLKPGTVCEDLYLDALRQVEEAGLSEHFMGFGDNQVKFLGHGIGLEIDELPVLAKGFTYLLEPGMVIAIEPKFTFPGRGVVGIENTYLITDEGFEKLTISLEGVREI